MRPWICALVHRHEFSVLTYGVNEIYLTCCDCGHRSAGWQMLKGSEIETHTPRARELPELPWYQHALGHASCSRMRPERFGKDEYGPRNTLGFDRRL